MVSSNQPHNSGTQPEGKLGTVASESLVQLIGHSDLAAIQSTIRKLQEPSPSTLSWWEWLRSWFHSAPPESFVPSEWSPLHIATLLVHCNQEELSSMVTALLKGSSEISLPRVAQVFRELGKMPLLAARQARSYLFMRYPFERHPEYEAYLIQELYAETQENREELRECFATLSPLRRLALVRLLDDDQLDCLLFDIESLLSTLDRSIRQLWLRDIDPRHADQFLDRLSDLWKRRSDLLETLLLDMPDESLDHFLITAQRRFRVATLERQSCSEIDSLHDLAFRILGQQVLRRLGQGQLEHSDALAILGKIPIDHLENTMLQLSGEMLNLREHLEALHHSLREGNHTFRYIDAHALDERLKRIRESAEQLALPTPEALPSTESSLSQYKVVPLQKPEADKPVNARLKCPPCEQY